MLHGLPFSMLKFPQFFGGQMGVPGSDTALGLRYAPQGLDYYVDGSHSDARDTNDGTDPNEPFATIQAAITANNALIDWAAVPPYFGMNTIHIAPGEYAEALTPPYYCRMIGGGQAMGGDVDVIVRPVAGSPMTGTGLGLYLENIRFDGMVALPVLDFDTFNSCLIFNCMISDGNPGLATVGIDIETAGGSSILGCNFAFSTNPMTIGIRSTGNFFDCEVTGNKIKAVTTGIDLSGAGLCGGSMAVHNMIWGGGQVLLGTGIDDSVVGDLLCVQNWITATDAISHADAAMTIDNHVMNAGVGAIETIAT